VVAQSLALAPGDEILTTDHEYAALEKTWAYVCRRSGAVEADIARLGSLWGEARRRFGHGGPFLFGAFGAADAYFAPVAFRFRTYGVEPGGEAGEVVRRLLAHPSVRAWAEAGAREPTLADHDLDAMYPDDPA